MLASWLWWWLPCPLLRTTGTNGSRQCRKLSGGAASAVLVVVDVAVSMQRQVRVLPGGGSDQFIDNVVDCVRVFRRFTLFFAPFRMEARAHFSALEHSHCECSSAPGVPESLGVVLPGDSALGLPIGPYSCVDIHIAGSSICVRNNHNTSRRAYCGSLHESVARTHPITSCVQPFFCDKQRCLDSFHPRVLIVRTVAPERAARSSMVCAA